MLGPPHKCKRTWATYLDMCRWYTGCAGWTGCIHLHVCVYVIMTVRIPYFNINLPCPPLISCIEFWYTRITLYKQKRLLKTNSKIELVPNHLQTHTSLVLLNTYILTMVLQLPITEVIAHF